VGQISLISSMLEWERRLKFEEERRANHRSEPYVNYLAAPQSCRKERKPFFAGVFRHRNESQALANVVEALADDSSGSGFFLYFGIITVQKRK
jgi:hypothetical protein